MLHTNLTTEAGYRLKLLMCCMNFMNNPQSFELEGFKVEMKKTKGDWVFKINQSPWLQTSRSEYAEAIESVKREIKKRQTERHLGDTCPWCDGKGILIYQHPGWQYEGDCRYCDGTGTIGQIEQKPLPRNGISEAIDCLNTEQLRAICQELFS